MEQAAASAVRWGSFVAVWAEFGQTVIRGDWNICRGSCVVRLVGLTSGVSSKMNNGNSKIIMNM